MKKKIVLFLTGLCAMTLLVGCGKKEEGAKEKEQNAGEYVTLGEYNEIEVSVENPEVTEEDVKTYIESMLAYYPSYKTLDKTVVENGDFVNIDYEGLKDGVAFGGGTASDQVLEIGSGSFIDGFEEGLIGVSVGETVALDLTFPDPYQNNPDLAGAAVVFNVTVNAIVEPEEVAYETLTDEYVVTNFSAYGYDSVQALKDDVLASLTASNESNLQTNIRSAVLDKILENCPVNELPKGELERRVKEYMDDFAAQCKEQYGMELAAFLEEYYQTTEEEFKEQTSSYMQENIEIELVLQAIADKEGIEIDEEGYQEYLTNMASYYQYTDTEMLIDEFGEDYMKTTYLGNKVLDQLVANAKVTYTQPENEVATDNTSGDVATDTEE